MSRRACATISLDDPGRALGALAGAVAERVAVDVLHVGRAAAERAEHRAERKGDDLPQPGELGDVAGMQRTGAADREQA